MWELIQRFNPFRFKYWMVYDYDEGCYVIWRSRLNPHRSDSTCRVSLIDGPFDYQEDAAMALAFWSKQYESVIRCYLEEEAEDDYDEDF